MTAPPSNRCTVPVTRSPRWSSNSSKRLSRSASRIFWMMTCLAVWAAIRPSSAGSILTPSLVASIAPESGSMRTSISAGFGIVLACRGGECRLNPLEQNILGDILVAVDAVDDADQIDAHSSPPRRAQDRIDRRPAERDAVRSGARRNRRNAEPRRSVGLGVPGCGAPDEQHLRGSSRRPRPHGILGAGSEPSPGRAEPDDHSPSPGPSGQSNTRLTGLSSRRTMERRMP